MADPTSAASQIRLPSPIDLVEGNSRYRAHLTQTSTKERRAARELLEACEEIRSAVADGRHDDGLVCAFALGILLQKFGGSKNGRSGGQARGITLKLAAARDDAKVKSLMRKFQQSDELQDQHRTVVAYIAKKTGQSPRNIRRRIGRLDLPVGSM